MCRRTNWRSPPAAGRYRTGHRRAPSCTNASPRSSARSTSSDRLPLTGPRAAADLAAVVPAGGLVAADPGPAGFWIARTFPTTAPGQRDRPGPLGPWSRSGCRGRGSPERPVDRAGHHGARRAGNRSPSSTGVAPNGAAVQVIVWGESGVLASADQHLDVVETGISGRGTGANPGPGGHRSAWARWAPWRETSSLGTDAGASVARRAARHRGPRTGEGVAMPTELGLAGAPVRAVVAIRSVCALA